MLAAGEGFGPAVKGQVAQADLADEPQAAFDLGYKHSGRRPGFRAQRFQGAQVGKPPLRFVRAQCGERGQGQSEERDAQGVGLEPAAAAVGAWAVAKQGAQRFASLVRVFARILLFDQGGQAGPGAAESKVSGAPAPLIRPDDVIEPVARTLEGQLPCLRPEIAEGDIEIDAGGRTRGLEGGDMSPVRLAVKSAGLAAVHRSPGQRQAGIGDQLVGVGNREEAEPAAAGTSALFGVEGEMSGGQAGGFAAFGVPAGARVEQAHIVVDLGHRPDRRSGMSARGPRTDGQGRGQSGRRLETGFLADIQAVADVGGKAVQEEASGFGL